jgi:hypothetical protein
MSWKKSKFASSLMSLFGESRPDPKAESRIEDIRQAMLDCLADVARSHEQVQAWARVLYAPDIQALWYLRSDLMLLLASPHGESAAMGRLVTITDMFKGLLPPAQLSRHRLRK